MPEYWVTRLPPDATAAALRPCVPAEWKATCHDHVIDDMGLAWQELGM